jgi:PPOX class probable F420-dependent enzyme
VPILDHTPDHARRVERLLSNTIAWLATTRPDGRPHLVPVWFLCLDDRIFVLTQPGSQKVLNIASNPYVSLALDDTDDGREPLVLEGRASLEQPAAHETALVALFVKYRGHLERMDWPEKSMRADYRQVIVIEITRVVAI